MRRFTNFSHRWQNLNTSSRTRIPILSHIIVGSALIGGFISLGLTARHERLWKERESLLKGSILEVWKDALLGGLKNSTSAQFPKTDGGVVDFSERIKLIVKRNFDKMREEEMAMWALVSINSLVFLAWQIPGQRVQRIMNRYFVHLPIANRPITLLTCVFSHQSLLHFGFNMMALHSFFPSFTRGGNFSIEQSLTMYLSAGVFSSLISHLASSWIPGRALIGGLGASGALYALLIGSSILNPTAGVGIIFIPGVTFQMQDLIPCILLMDVAGVLFRWKSLDHIAHLGGALFGYLWLKEGRFYWSDVQKDMLERREKSA